LAVSDDALAGIQTRIIQVDPRELKLLEKNARFMKSDVFRRLVENIRNDGCLTSVPFAWRESDDAPWEVLSGNHRTMAAIEAGIAIINLMVTDERLPRERRIAIQISHNAIEGEDDPAILRSLWDEINSVEMKVYAGLDDKTLEQLAKVDLTALSEVSLETRQVTFMFLPNEAEQVAEAFEQAKQLLSSKEVYLARMADYDRALDAVAASGASYGVKNTATSMAIVMDTFERHITDLQEGYLDEDGEATHDGWVPLATIVGSSTVPADVAAVLTRLVKRMEKDGDVTDKAKWRALELAAADYLGG
jgi:hypothetical protein